MLIAVESWEAYNSGHLFCKWWNTEEDTIEEIEEWCAKQHRSLGLDHTDMELFIADVDGEAFDLIKGDESLHEAYRVSEEIEAIDEDNYTPIKLLLENGVVSDLDDAVEHLDDLHNTGETSMEDIARIYTEDCLEVPKNLEFYIDYESMGRDMEINGSFYEDEDGVLWEYID